MMTLNRLSVGIPALTGFVALALPFTYGISPLIVIPRYLECGWGCGGIEFVFLAVPMFLVIPIALLQVHRLVADRVAPVAVRLSYTFSAAAVLPILVLSVWFVWGGIHFFWREIHASPERLISGMWLYVVSGLSSWGFAVINLLLLLRNLARRLPREVNAEVFLLGGYLPNAVWCLVDFGFFPGWEVGAYLVLGTCIGYVFRIAFLLWRRGDDAPRPTALAGEPAHSPHAGR